MLDNLLTALDECDTCDERRSVLHSYVSSGKIAIFHVDSGFNGIEENGYLIVADPGDNASTEEFDALLMAKGETTRFSNSDGYDKIMNVCIGEMVKNVKA